MESYLKKENTKEDRASWFNKLIINVGGSCYYYIRNSLNDSICLCGLSDNQTCHCCVLLRPERPTGPFFVCPLSLDWLKLPSPIFSFGNNNLNFNIFLGELNISHGKNILIACSKISWSSLKVIKQKTNKQKTVPRWTLKIIFWLINY